MYYFHVIRVVLVSVDAESFDDARQKVRARRPRVPPRARAPHTRARAHPTVSPRVTSAPRARPPVVMRRASVQTPRAFVSSTSTRNASRGSRAASRARATPADAREDESADGRDVLGVYVTASAVDVRAAPVNSRTGAFLRAGASTKLESATTAGVVDAVRKVVETMEWRGALGVSLPGLVTRIEGEASDATKGTLSRAELEAAVRTATGCEVAISSGAEACGAAELAYGAGIELGEIATKGLVMFCMVGGRFSTSLYDAGQIVKNFSGEKVVHSWDGAVDRAMLPESGGATDNEAGWNSFADRVNEYLMELEDKYKPEAIILGGKAGQNADKILPRLTCRTKVVPGTLGFVAGVKGAARLAAQRLETREALSRVREAIGVTAGVSPQFVTEEQLKSVFDTFDTSRNGVLELKELIAATEALNVKLGDPRDLMNMLDLDDNGVVTFDEWVRWWKSEVKNETITTIASQNEWHKIMKAERDRLICLEVGFTFCRPCKAFAKKFHQIAEEFPSVKFVFVHGNENGSTTILARDELGVKATPSFYLFRSGQKVHFHSGAKEERLRNAINRHLRDSEWPVALGTRPPVISEEEELRIMESSK